MNPKQLRALEKSITHWDLVCQGLEPVTGGEKCECCKQFANWCCFGCPIWEAFEEGCTGLGFYQYTALHDKEYTIPENWHLCWAREWYAGIEQAELILTRLINLLPTSHKWANQNV